MFVRRRLLMVVTAPRCCFPTSVAQLERRLHRWPSVLTVLVTTSSCTGTLTASATRDREEHTTSSKFSTLYTSSYFFVGFVFFAVLKWPFCRHVANHNLVEYEAKNTFGGSTCLRYNTSHNNCLKRCLWYFFFGGGGEEQRAKDQITYSLSQPIVWLDIVVFI